MLYEFHIAFIFIFRFKKENRVNEIGSNNLPFMYFFFLDLVMNFLVLFFFNSQVSQLLKMNIHQNTNVLIVAYINDVINSRNQSELAVISSLHMESASQILNATQACFLLVSKFCFCVFFFFLSLPTSPTYS